MIIENSLKGGILMNFDQLETFLTICKISNFTRAANELNITQPAVTARITSLEQELDCRLFTINKNKRPILTKEGEIFLKYAKKLVNDMYDAKQAIILSKKPRINLGFPPNFSSQIITESLNNIELGNTFISIRKGKDSDELTDLTLNNELILSFVYNPLYNRNLIVEEIKKVKMIFLISNKHPLADEIKITNELLLNETMICYSRYTKLMVNIEDKLKNLNLNKIEVHDVETMKYLLESGFGFAILPEMSINNNDRKNFSIKQVDILEDLSLELCAIYRKEIEYDEFLQNIIKSSIHSVKQVVSSSE